MEQDRDQILKEAKRKMAEAKSRVAYDFRFFGYGMLRSTWKWDWDMLDPVGNKPTMATDGQRKFVHPQFVLDHDVAVLAGVIMHEVDHDYLLHPIRITELVNGNKGRASARTLQTLGNIAADMLVNHHVELAGGELPEWTVPPKENTTMDAEFYRLLNRYDELKEEQQQSGDGDGEQQGEGGEGGSSEDDILRKLAQEEGLAEALHGMVVEFTKDDGSKLSESEKRVEGTRMRGLIEAAMEAARKAGQLPAGVEQFFKNKLKPLVPWQDIINRFVGGHNREDYSWRRLSRRCHGGAGVLLPGLYNPEPAKLLFAPDTSGSMYGGPLDRVGAELFSAAQLYTTDPEITVLWWDTAVYKQVIQNPDELHPQGGGGTSTRALFKYINDEEEDAQGVVVMTDGYLYEVGDEPHCDVLWVVVGPNKDFDPPFGEVAYYVEAR